VQANNRLQSDATSVAPLSRVRYQGLRTRLTISRQHPQRLAPATGHCLQHRRLRPESHDPTASSRQWPLWQPKGDNEEMCRRSSSGTGRSPIDEELEAFLRDRNWFILGIGVVFLATSLAAFACRADPDDWAALCLLPGAVLLIGAALWDLWASRT